MVSGDLRSVVQARDAERLKTLRIETDDPATTLNYLFHRGYEWLVPACEWSCDWMTRHSKKPSEGLYASSEDDWALPLAGLRLADGTTFDMFRAQHAWSIVPAWMSLPAWWAWADEALARGEISQEIYDAPMNAILAKWKWCQGEISDAELGEDRAAAISACSAADSSYSAAHWSVQSAAYSTADSAISATTSAYSAAYWSAQSTAYSTATSTAYSAAQSEFNALFTEYVLYCLANKIHVLSLDS